MQDTLDITGSD